MIISILMFLGLHTPLYQANDCLIEDLRYSWEREADENREFADTPSKLSLRDVSIYKVLKQGQKNYQILWLAHKGYLFNYATPYETPISKIDSNKDYSKVDCSILEPKENE